MPGLKSRKKKDPISSPDLSKSKRKKFDDDIFDEEDDDVPEEELQDNSMFGQVVKDAGMTLKGGSNPHVLDCDKVVPTHFTNYIRH